MEVLLLLMKCLNYGDTIYKQFVESIFISNQWRIQIMFFSDKSLCMSSMRCSLNCALYTCGYHRLHIIFSPSSTGGHTRQGHTNQVWQSIPIFQPELTNPSKISYSQRALFCCRYRNPQAKINHQVTTERTRFITAGKQAENIGIVIIIKKNKNPLVIHTDAKKYKESQNWTKDVHCIEGFRIRSHNSSLHCARDARTTARYDYKCRWVLRFTLRIISSRCYSPPLRSATPKTAGQILRNRSEKGVVQGAVHLKSGGETSGGWSRTGE